MEEKQPVKEASNNDSELPESLNLDHVSPATRLLEKRRQMGFVQDHLDSEKEEFLRRQEQFKRREDAIKEKDVEFQKSLVKFNKSLKENEIKTNRAVKKIAEEKKPQVQKDAELNELQIEYENPKKKRDELREKVAKGMKYQRYLESVQDAAPDDYLEIKDILNRFRVLKDAHAAMKAKGERNEAQIDKVRKALTELTADSNNKVLNLTDTVAALQNVLEAAQQNSSKREKEMKAEVEIARKKSLELGVTCLAIENVLNRCTAEYGKILKHGHELSQEPTATDTDTLNTLNGEQAVERDARGRAERAVKNLDVICSYILDYRKTIANLSTQAV